MTWCQDPDFIAVDAFRMPWKCNTYAIPSFSIVNVVLEKIRADQARGVLVVSILNKCHVVTNLLLIKPGQN